MIRKIVMALGIGFALSEVTIAADSTSFIGLNGRVNSIAFSPDGTLIAGSSGPFIGLLQEPRPGKLLIWKFTDGKLLADCSHYKDGVSCVEFSPIGKWVAAGSYDGTLRLWNSTDGHSGGVLAGNKGPILAMAFAGDGKSIAAGGMSGQVAIWDVAQRKLLTSFTAGEGHVNAVQFLNDSSSIATGSMDGTIKIWSLNPVQLSVTLSEVAGGVYSLRISPDRGILAATGGHLLAGAGGDKAGAVKLWSVGTRRELASALLPAIVWSAAFSPDGKRLATAADEGTIRIFDTPDLRQVAAVPLHAESTRCVSFTPKGDALVASGPDGRIDVLPTTQPD